MLWTKELNRESHNGRNILQEWEMTRVLKHVINYRPKGRRDYAGPRRDGFSGEDRTGCKPTPCKWRRRRRRSRYKFVVVKIKLMTAFKCTQIAYEANITFNN